MTRPPSGTITFLFTDIEESTLHWQKHPSEMPAALARHHAILQSAVDSHDGYVFQIVGDAFCAAFSTALDALAAALDAQRALQSEPWNAAGPLQVRMGLHTGAAELNEGNVKSGQYASGVTLVRAQRIMSAAHGGQVLLSGPTEELLRDHLPVDVALVDLFEHRLKGLLNPEHLWQATAVGLPQEFPALESLNAIPNNLPVQLTSFVGRGKELAAVEHLLSTTHLVTLTGPGGTGKTRLSLRVGADLLDQYQDGVYFVELASAREPTAVVAAIARTIGFKEKKGQPLLDALKTHLREQTILLILDNFEQVTEAAPLAVELLQDCPRLNLLVTSREALHVRGERVFPVPPLGLPGKEIEHLSISQLAACETVTLFIERARAVKPDLELTTDNIEAIAQICTRLDGLPLAIELAAARTRVFSPPALLKRLASRLDLLRGGARDLPVRQQTLRDTIDWSYELLDSRERTLFQVLSVFSGCTIDAVESVTAQFAQGTETEIDVLDGLTSLVDKSLLRQVDEDTGETRFRMLETIREAASEHLNEHPELSAQAHKAHAIYFADLAARQGGRLNGDERQAALAVMTAEVENMRAAWRYWVAERNLEQLEKMSDSLWVLNNARSWYRTTIELTTDLLNVLATAPSTPERAQQQIVLQSNLARALMATKGYTEQVEQAYRRAIELCQKEGQVPQLFSVLRALTSFYIARTEFDKARQLGEQILDLADHLDDENMRAEGHFVLGSCLAFLGDLRKGEQHLDQAIACYDVRRQGLYHLPLGNNAGVTAYTTSAMLLWMLGFPDRALERADAGLALAKQLNHPFSVAYSLFHNGLLHFWRREPDQSVLRAQAVLEVAAAYEFQIWNAVGACLHGVASAALGSVEQGLAEIEEGMKLYQGLKTPPVFWPMLLSLKSAVCGMAARPSDGLLLIDEALGSSSTGPSRGMSVDFHLLRGDLLLAISPENQTQVASCYQTALDLAREFQAPMLELQAAVSLARLWRAQGKEEPAKSVLRTAYAQMTEGFTLPIMQEASTILNESSPTSTHMKPKG